MKSASFSRPDLCGATLLESVIAISVLAVAIPMVFGTLAESGKSGVSSRAETRSSWIVPVCMEEIRASREGRARYIPNTPAGQTFPPAGEVWAIAFAADGSPVGKIPKSDYESGIKELSGKPVRYIASLSATEETANGPGSPMLTVRISIEHPSGAKAAKRRKLDFHSRIP